MQPKSNRPSLPPRPSAPSTAPPGPSTSSHHRSRPRGPRKSQSTQQAKPRPEDAQPSEAITSNRRPSAPPPVQTATVTSTPLRWQMTSGPDPRTPRAMVPTGPTAQKRRTTAGGWAPSAKSSNATKLNEDGKGKGRQWGAPTPTGPAAPIPDGRREPNASDGRGRPGRANGSNGSASRPPVVPTPVPVPINPRPKLYVAALPPSVTEEEVRAVFAPFGEMSVPPRAASPAATDPLTKVRLARRFWHSHDVSINNSQLKSAFAHVTFASADSATSALHALHNEPFPSESGIGSSRPLKIQYAKTNDQKAPAARVEGGGVGTGGTGGAGGNATLVTTSMPAQLFRDRDTPELSQSQVDRAIVKTEAASPVKTRLANQDRARNGDGDRYPRRPSPSSSRSRPPSPSSTPNPSSHPPSHRASPHELDIPRYLDLPPIYLDSCPFPPAQQATYQPVESSGSRHEPSPGYAVSWVFPDNLLSNAGWTRDSINPRHDLTLFLRAQVKRLGFALDPRSLECIPLDPTGPDPFEGGPTTYPETRDRSRDVLVRFRIDRPTRGALEKLGSERAWTVQDCGELGEVWKEWIERERDMDGRSAGDSIDAAAGRELEGSGAREGSRGGTSASMRAGSDSTPRPVLQADGTYVERIPLPRSTFDVSTEQSGLDASASAEARETDRLRKQTLFRVEQVKVKSQEGKIVLSSSIDGDYVSINYFVDESNPAAPKRDSASQDQPPQASRRNSAMLIDEEDVKPFVPSAGDRETAGSAPGQEVEMEALETSNATASNDGDRLTPRVSFPFPIVRNGGSGDREAQQAAKAFIPEYFRRFDSARSTLETLYTQNAFFSLKLDTTVPARLTTAPPPFSRLWSQSSNKFASTPIAITNAIRQLPAVSHDVESFLFSARPIPEFHLRKRDKPPILVHIVGTFDEFPEHVVRSFSRTFVLVPRSSNQTEGPGDFIVHSDQLAVGYRVDGEPSDLAVSEFRPDLNPTPQSTAPPVLRAREASSSNAGPPTALSFATTLPPRHPGRLLHTQSYQGPFSRFAPPAPSPASPVAQSSEKRPRADSASTPVASTSAGPVPSSPSSPRPQEGTMGTTPDDRDGDDVLILSDTESVVSTPPASRGRRTSSLSRTAPDASDVEGVPNTASITKQDGRGRQSVDEEDPSMSPELVRPSKRPNLGPEPLVLAQGTPSMARGPPRDPAPAPSSASKPAKKRKTNPQKGAAASSPSSATLASLAKEKGLDAAAKGADISVEDLQKFLQLAKRLEGYLGDDAGGAEGAVDSSSAAGDDVNGKKKGKGKAKEKDKVEDKTKKSKAKKDKAPTGLGTGLSPGDSRIVIGGPGYSILHGFDGRSNKLRGMVPIADASSFLSVSFLGDVAEWKMQPLHAMNPASITKLYSSNQDKYRVDDFAYNEAKDTLLVGYLGAKEGKENECPPNQVVLYKRDTIDGSTKLIETRLPDAPHVNGGVTAIMTLPNKASTGRLRFVTGGEDKKVYLWTRQRSTQEVKLEKFRTEHTAMITSLACLEQQYELVSGGKDRRLVLYDLERRQATWQATVAAPCMSVSPIICDPNLVLSRLSTPSNQFLIHDRRVDAASPPVATFGYDLPDHRSTTGQLLPTNMGRYPRGDQCDTVVAFPDHDQGVKLWDLRHLRSAIPIKKQDLGGLGRSKVVQASFRGRNELCLMELSHFTRLSIKG
ncbi:hypothetical protein JCM10212_001171 [Sporobolomyces blumeae]